MTLPFVFAKTLDVAFGWAAGKLADANILPRIESIAARAELVKITQAAVDATVIRVPALESDIRSPAFINWVLVPALLDSLRKRNTQLSANELAELYANRFLKPFLRDRELSDVLVNLFHIEMGEFVQVFGDFLKDLRRRLYASKHWREPIRDLDIGEIRVGVLGIISPTPPLPPPDEDWEVARKDAREASSDLRAWEQRIQGLYIDRPELATLRERILTTPAAATLLVGASGAGKSALLARLTRDLEDDGMIVFAIKADLLPRDVRNLHDVSLALGMQADIIAEIDALARHAPVVIIIDQLDAVSEVMDRSSRRMTLLLQLANRWSNPQARGSGPPVHVVVSSRPFEASYDGRFKTIEASTVELGLPSFDSVAALLVELGIDANQAPEGLRETLRRPFWLKLFVDIALRGDPIGSLVNGELLNAWLTSAQLGDDASRAGVLALLTALADEMTVTETLWRPADRFIANHTSAVKRAEACEILVRKGASLGFAHQAWLDDFQARSFMTADALMAHVWSTQDALFGRATTLRALERLRALETNAYGMALDALLGQPRTRRHLRHLAIDLVAVQQSPHPREIAWIERLLIEDTVLSRRAANRIVDRWPGWRTTLAPLIPKLAKSAEHRGVAVVLTIAEAKLDGAAADILLSTTWSAEALDNEALEVIWRAKLWSPVVRVRVAAAITRMNVASYWIAHFGGELAEAGRGEDAADLLALFLGRLDAADAHQHQLHGLEKICETAPLAYAKAVLPWFLKIVGFTPSDNPTARNQYQISYSLPYNWQEDDHDGELLPLLQKSINIIAKTNPAAFIEQIAPLNEMPVDDIQGMIAEGFAAAGPLLAEEAIDWLLGDPRRLRVGSSHAKDVDGVYGLIQGYSTGQLLAAAAAHLSPERLEYLVQAIETWDAYTPMAYEVTGPKDRREMRQLSESYRAQLLMLLPSEALSARRQRQVAEFTKAERRPFVGKRAGRSLAGFSRPRMNAEQMALATDADIFGMLDQVSDKGAVKRATRRHFLEGGPAELANAFGAFAKAHPVRAMELAQTRFQAGRQEGAAGAMVRELSGQEDVAPHAVLDLVRDFNARGFESKDWRRDAGWAMQNIAVRRKGLEAQDLKILESWLNIDADDLADQTVRRKANEDANRERNSPKEPGPAQALLFGPGLRTFGIIPQDNNTYLSAIGAGLTCREPPAHDAWLGVLERHTERPEDPAIWASLFHRYAWSLHHADHTRVEALLRKLLDRHPGAFVITTARDVWLHRDILPRDVQTKVILAWIAQGGQEGLQVAGEYAMASTLVDSFDDEISELADRLNGFDGGPAQIGTLFAAAAVWREVDDERRERAHGLLMQKARTAAGPSAEAISSALDRRGAMSADSLTRELLEAARDNVNLLKACLNRFFLDALQGLLLHPGFEELVLEVAERSVDLLLGDENQRRSGLIDHDFVTIAVALQRNTGMLRPRAMDLYEKLLDAGNFGAEQTARASLQR